MECAVVPLRRIEVKIDFLRKVTKAVKEAKETGVRDPAGFIKKILDSRIKYKAWKDSEASLCFRTGHSGGGE